jgi:NTP pyrophosphatase (non-canonical NTP hydrolase)
MRKLRRLLNNYKNDMELNEYQKKALDTALYPEKYKIVYPALGLGNEAGEVMGKIKKWLRGDDGEGVMSDERREGLKGELGDVLWYLAVLARDLDISLEDVAKENIEKLQSRKERGALKGDGDKR